MWMPEKVSPIKAVMSAVRSCIFLVNLRSSLPR